MAAPQQGAAGGWETRELPPCLSLWGSFRPSLEHFPACPLLGISPEDSISPASPLCFSASPYPFLPHIPFLLFYLSSFSHHPFSGFGLLSPLFPTSISITPHCTPHLPHPAISFQNPSHRPFPHSPHSLTPAIHTLINTVRRQPLSSCVPLLSFPSSSSVPQGFRLRRLAPPTPLSWHAPSSFSPPPNVPLGGTPAFLERSFLLGGRVLPLLLLFPLAVVPTAALASIPAPFLLNSCPPPRTPPVTSDPPPSPTSPSSTPRSLGQSARRVRGGWRWRWQRRWRWWELEPWGP